MIRDRKTGKDLKSVYAEALAKGRQEYVTTSARVGSLITNANFLGDSSALCWVVPRTLPSSPPHWQHPPRRGCCCLKFVMEVDNSHSWHAHCPSWSPPADFCSTCGAAPLRVCLRKRASQRIDEISDCLLPTRLYKYYVVSCCIVSYHVISCYFWRSHTAQHVFRPSPLT